MYKFTFTAPPDVPQNYIDASLTDLFLKQIGGLRSFDKRKVVFDVEFIKERDRFAQYIEQYTHTLAVEVTNIQIEESIKFIKPPSEIVNTEIVKRYTRWERFKQFLKGE